jgi:outer membrane immunogenic protein
VSLADAPAFRLGQEIFNQYSGIVNRRVGTTVLGSGGVTRIRFAVTIAAAAFSITSAGAADLGRFPPPARFYPPPAAAVRVYNWTGCYLGAQFGGAFSNDHVDGVFPTGPGTTGPLNQNLGPTGVLIGGQGGCDLQFARNWVIGGQIDGDWTNLNSSVGLNAGSSSHGTFNVKTNSIATATGRIGYAVNFDTIAGLFYLKGGAAFLGNDTSNFIGHIPGSNFNFSAPSESRWGWTIGLGTEWAIFENWSIFGEWDYMNFGTNNVTFTDPAFGSSQVSIKQNINELKLGINYRFGNPLPGYP